MQPQRKHSEDSSPQDSIRPKFGVIQGGGESSERSSGHLNAVPSNGASGAELKALEGGGETSEPRRGHLKAVDDSDSSGSGLKGAGKTNTYHRPTIGSLGATDLKDAEKTNLYKPVEQEKVKKQRFTGWWNKKRVAVAGGVTGAVAGGGLLGLSILSGPAQFIHIAQILQRTHFSQQEDAGDGRMGKLYRYMRAGGSVGETRLGYLESKYHAKMIGQLESIGIKPTYGVANTYDGFTLDTDGEKSPYKGMTPEQAARTFEDKTGIKPTIEGRTLRVDANTFWSQRKSLNAALGELGNTRLTTAIRARVLGKYGLVTWHPLKILDKKALNTSAKINEYLKEKWDNRITKGIEPAAVRVNGGVDEKGNPIVQEADPAIAEETVKDSSKSSQLMEDIKSSNGLKWAGGIAAVAGVTCGLKAVNDNVATIRYENIVKPMIRVGMDAITVGEQVASGKDIDQAELAFLSEQLYETDAKTGKTNTWNDATSVRVNTDQEGGIDSTKQNGLIDLLSQDSISWLDWTKAPVFSALCSTAGTITTGVISVGIGVISGAYVSTAVGFLASSALTGPIINLLAGMLGGDAFTTDKLKGANWGGVADLGSRMGANAISMQFGGVPLTAKQSIELNNQTNQQDEQDFATHSFFARMFDPMDARSLLSQAYDSQAGKLSNTANLVSGFGSVFANALRSPLKIVGASSKASALSTYNYGVPQLGFSVADRTNPLVENPYTNAASVATILNQNGQNGTPDYIKRAYECFGVDITNTPGQGWGVEPQTDINAYGSEYEAKDCTGSSDQNWLKVRFFIMDMGVMESNSCLLGDEESCTHSGFTNVDTASTGVVVGGDQGDGDDYGNACYRSTGSTYGVSCSGQCVDFVWYRINKHVKQQFWGLGNGNTAAPNLVSKYGYEGGHTPAVHAVVSWPAGGVPGPGGKAHPQYGHTAIVAQVNPDGSIVIEEYNGARPLNYSTRTIPAATAAQLDYAHVEKDPNYK